MKYSDYEELSTTPHIEHEDGTVTPHRHFTSRISTVHLLLAISVFINLILGTIVLARLDFHRQDILFQTRYSPALDVISKQDVKFTRGFGLDTPVYEQEPSPEVDEAWFKLHEYSAIVLSSEEISRLPNNTERLPENHEEAVISMDVFHQLHCLNMIRKVSQPEYYTNYSLPASHVRHCIGAIRQALMCFGDVTPVVWQLNSTSGKVEQRDDVVHTCRNFDSIREWAGRRLYGTGQWLPKYEIKEEHV